MEIITAPAPSFTHDEVLHDMKIVKETVYTLLTKIGFIREDGSFRDTIDMKKIMGLVMGAATGSAALKTEMQFLTDILPLIEKYKHL